MTFTRFDPEAATASPLSMALDARGRETMQMVREAVEQRRVVLAFQPVVQTACPGRMAYYEGLLRVLEPSGRIIPAQEFINTVEDQEIGRKLDTLALEQGLQALVTAPDLRLSVNMSARSIGYPAWNKVLQAALLRDPTIAERLILEITERTAIVMPDLVQVFMNDLQMKGVSFALDNFGAGYSSFRYLRDFYFDILKIDGAFIGGIARSPDTQVLLQAMLSLARHFDMFTVAENVENHDDAAFLTGIGIDGMQGYYFGAPTIRPYWVSSDPRESLIA